MTFDLRYALANYWRRHGRPDVPRGVSVQPAAPTNLASSDIADTTVTLTWTLSTSPGITEQRIYLNNSRHTTVNDGTSNTVQITGLTANTSYLWRVTAYNGSTQLNSPWSTAYQMTTSGSGPTGSPNTPNNFAAVKSPTFPTTQINVSWTAPTVDGSHAFATGYRVYRNDTQQGPDLSSGNLSYVITVDPGSTSAITVKAFNDSGESLPTTTINVTTDLPSITEMMMGCSTRETGGGDSGGTLVWDGWRAYRRSPLYEYVDRAGVPQVKFMAYSAEGEPLGSVGNSVMSNMNYDAIYAFVLNELNTFYYSGTGQTHSARWPIKLYWSNGNEMHDKGILSSLTTANINTFTNISQKALYDAVHVIDSTTGSRRFPNAYAGSNPVHWAEYLGGIEAWLHPSAKYHDFVMWSMYPGGRQETLEDPTWDWPTLNLANRNVLPDGFIARCFYRTQQAQAQARIDTGNSNFSISISCGEVGTGNDPDDSTTRPYYAVHGLAGAAQSISDTTGIPIPFMCWWDNDIGGGQNILSDEQVGTSPSTREAWQNWRSYNHVHGGTHPASWAGNPKASWKNDGATPI